MRPIGISRVRPSVRGISLVELMVGVAIGVVAVLAIMQVLLASGSSARNATSGDDAQVSGALGSSTLLRDVRQAGQGFNNTQLFGCSLALPGGWTLPTLAPVIVNPPTSVIPAGDANTDTLLVVSGNGYGSPEGDAVNGQPATNRYTVATPSSYAIGDLVIARPSGTPAPPTCSLSAETVSQIPPGTSIVQVGTGVTGMVNGVLYNLGHADGGVGSPLRAVAYAVRSGALTACDYYANNCSLASNLGNSNVWVPVAPNVVSLRAEYGRDTSATPNCVANIYDQTSGTTATDWMRVVSLRFSIVTRGDQYDKDYSASAPTWADQASTPINVSGISNWQRYHYKVFQTTVPLRNIVWQGAGC